MYGLLLESICCYLRSVYGEETFAAICKKANIAQTTFSAHNVYSESAIPRLARAAQEITGMPYDEFMDAFGVAFVSFVTKYGYDRILKVLGRNMIEFLNNLDNLHEYLRFSYPKIKPPSFLVTDVSAHGVVLHYRSKRKGFFKYMQGQVRQVAKLFYNIDLKIEVISREESPSFVQGSMKLMFDNKDYREHVTQGHMSSCQLLVTPKDFFSLFPFHMAFDHHMMITSAGQAMVSVLPHVLGSQLDDLFHLERPIMDFTVDFILSHTNNVFELHSVDPIENRFEDDSSGDGTIPDEAVSMVSSDHKHYKRSLLRLRGQMMYQGGWNSILFLATPVMENLDHMFQMGLYITDLSIHDSSRELILAGSQQSAELKMLLDQEQTKSRRLEDSMKKLDLEVKKTDQLLYQMIPRTVADRLRSGEPAVNTCEAFESCTIMFSDVVGFTNISSQISPMQVVSMLNAMYICFDTLIAKHRCYKVETIGDAYMVVGGVPEKSEKHAEDVAEMAFDMLRSAGTLRDPSDETEHLKLRVGIHSGMVVAGVVGIKMPRYCLFGDTVNTASRMETNGEAMKIHISQTTKELLNHCTDYVTEERGIIEVKGKGKMKTFWLSNTESDSHFLYESSFHNTPMRGHHPVQHIRAQYPPALSSPPSSGKLGDLKSMYTATADSSSTFSAQIKKTSIPTASPALRPSTSGVLPVSVVKPVTNLTSGPPTHQTMSPVANLPNTDPEIEESLVAHIELPSQQETEKQQRKNKKHDRAKEDQLKPDQPFFDESSGAEYTKALQSPPELQSPQRSKRNSKCSSGTCCLF